MARYLDTDIYAGIRYTPETFQERAIVPIAMRERHDAAEEFIDSQIKALADLKINEKLRDEYVSNKTNEFNAKFDELANNFYSSGAGNMSNINAFKNLKRELDRELSITGGLGARANITKQFDTQRELLVADANKKGYDPNIQLAWLNRDLENYMGQVLGEDGNIIVGQLPDFVGTAAPNKFDTLGWLTKTGNLAKFTSVLTSESDVSPDINPVTGEIIFTTTNKQNLTEHNKQQLDEVAKALNYQINNPNSEMYISKRHQLGPDATHEEITEALRNELIPLLNSQRYSKTTDQTQTSIKEVGKNTGNNRSNTDKKEDKGTLIEYQFGNELGDDISITDLDKEINNLERKEHLGTNTDEDNRKKHEYLALREVLKEKEKDPKFIEEVENKIKKQLEPRKYSGSSDLRSLTNRGLKDLNDLDEFIATMSNNPSLEEDILKHLGMTREEYIQHFNNLIANNNFSKKDYTYINDNFPVPTSPSTILTGNFGGLRNIELVSKLANGNLGELAEAKNIKENAYKETLKGQSLLYRKEYKLGTTEKDIKIKQNIDAGLNNQGLRVFENLLLNDGGKIIDLKDGGEYNLNDDTSKFSELFYSGGKNVIEFDGITDRGLTGISTLDLKVINGEGKDAKEYSIKLNLDRRSLNNSAYVTILQSIYSELDESSKAILDNIMITAENIDVAVDGIDWAKSGNNISDSQDRLLKTKSIKALQDNNVITSYNKQEINSIDYFQNPNYKNVIVRDNEGFFFHVQESDVYNDIRVTKTGQWFERDNMLNYSNGTYITKNAVPNINSSTTDELMQFNAKVGDMASHILKGNIKVGNNPEEAERIKREVEDLLEAVRKLGEPTNIDLNELKTVYGGSIHRRNAVLQYKIFIEFFNNIKDSNIYFKNPSRFYRENTKYFSDKNNKNK